MALTFGFYSDPALTTPVDARLPFVQTISAPTAVDAMVYFGSPLAGRLCQAASDPGVDPVVISIIDAAPGTGSPAADVKLALSSGALAGATGGANLVLPAIIDGGFGNAIEIHVRVLDSTHASGLHVDLSVMTNPIEESI